MLRYWLALQHYFLLGLKMWPTMRLNCLFVFYLQWWWSTEKLSLFLLRDPWRQNWQSCLSGCGLVCGPVFNITGRCKDCKNTKPVKNLLLKFAENPSTFHQAEQFQDQSWELIRMSMASSEQFILTKGYVKNTVQSSKFPTGRVFLFIYFFRWKDESWVLLGMIQPWWLL